MEGRASLLLYGTQPEFDKRIMEWLNTLRSKVRSGAQPPNEFLDLDHLLHDMRLYKVSQKFE